MQEFIEFGKIPRLSREVVITEKIDGTNGAIYIGLDGEFQVGSRSRWITPEMDNHGFAAWAHRHRDELEALGHGFHYGEWWGRGIQKRYGKYTDVKKFSLFNVARWSNDAVRPACCDVVPTVASGEFSTNLVQLAMDFLRGASLACPGCPNPEGIIIFHTASRHLYKKTFEGDEKPKTLAEAA